LCRIDPAWAANRIRAELAAKGELESALAAAREERDAIQKELDEAVDDLERLGGENSTLRKERDEAREELNARNTCIVCKGALIPHDEPPHCEGCIVDDEHLHEWEERHDTTTAGTEE